MMDERLEVVNLKLLIFKLKLSLEGEIPNHEGAPVSSSGGWSGGVISRADWCRPNRRKNGLGQWLVIELPRAF